MAFIRRNLAPLGGNVTPISLGSAETVPGTPQLYSYRTADAATVVDAAGYFNEVWQLLKPGDVILRVTINASGVVQNAGFHVVMTVNAATGAVDVTYTLALTVTNTRV